MPRVDREHIEVALTRRDEPARFEPSPDLHPHEGLGGPPADRERFSHQPGRREGDGSLRRPSHAFVYHIDQGDERSRADATVLARHEPPVTQLVLWTARQSRAASHHELEQCEEDDLVWVRARSFDEDHGLGRR